MKILIAEDDPISHRLLTANLEKWGHQVTGTSDGQVAADTFAGDTSYQMAILDWMMPGMQGIEVCRSIKARSVDSFTYIIMLTAKMQQDDIVTALEVGADDYITKPFSAPELKARIRAGERIVELEANLQTKIAELEDALAHVKTLQGIIPICAWCKRIRDDSSYWHEVEDYVEHHSTAEFSHGACPDCLKKVIEESKAAKEKVAERAIP